MPRFTFTNLSDPHKLERLFQHISTQRPIDEEHVRSILGEVAENSFLNTTEPVTNELWDFGSWIDALNHADLTWDSLEIDGDRGTLRFTEHSWPSGGSDATENMLTIFGAETEFHDD